jgi:predicted regulator of Ras-like GTPase activity (Roadblock/LC7/MglB family)
MQEVISYLGLEQEFSKIPSLQGVIVSVMPDGLLYDSYVPPSASWMADDVALKLAEVLQYSQQLSRAFDCSPSNQMTLETDDGIVVIRELHQQFVVGTLFSEDLPMALIRSFSLRVIERIEQELAKKQTKSTPQAASNAMRVLRYLKQYTPDPHTSMMRVALKTGIPLSTLNQPQELNAEQTTKIETAVKEMLGLEELAF